MQRLPSVLLAEPDGDDHSQLGRREDLGAGEPLVAEEELAHLVSFDRTPRRHVVLDEDPTRSDEGEDRLPALWINGSESAVDEDESERAAPAQLLIHVSFQQLDIGEACEALARDRDTLGIALDRDDRARGLSEESGCLSVGGTHLGHVASGGESAEERLHLWNRGRAGGHTSGGASPASGETSAECTITASTPARSSSCTSSSVVTLRSAIASLPAGTSARSSSTASSRSCGGAGGGARRKISGSRISSARSSSSSLRTSTAQSRPSASASSWRR